MPFVGIYVLVVDQIFHFFCNYMQRCAKQHITKSTYVYAPIGKVLTIMSYFKIRLLSTFTKDATNLRENSQTGPLR